MKMRIPSLEPEPALGSAGLLVLRVVVGATLLVHGLDKLIDLASAERYFTLLDIPAPGLTAPAVAIIESVGGGLLTVGLATRLVGLALAGDMLVAFLTAHIGNGFFVEEGGGELVLVLGGASLALVLTGAGRFSLDSALGVGGRFLQRLDPASRTGARPRGGSAVGRARVGVDRPKQAEGAGPTKQARGTP
jgi:putative oxidoreductase